MPWTWLDVAIGELPMHLERTSEPRRLQFPRATGGQGGTYPARAMLRRISAVAMARAEPVPPSRATKAHRMARKHLVAAVLYDPAGARTEKITRSRHSMETSEGCAGLREWCRSAPQMRGRRYERR